MAKEDVGDFDGQNHRQQRALGGLQLANPLGNGGVGRAAAHQPQGRIEQKQAEDPGDPVEALQQRDAGGDEERAQHHRSGDAPQQRVVLALLADLEALKDDQEDEEIVDAERGFDGVAGDAFKRGLPALGSADPRGEAGRGEHESRRSKPGE